jgi:hypothetical protein
VAELVLRRLLPLAYEGLRRWNVDTAEQERLLGIIEQRCTMRRTGSDWQVEAFRKRFEATSAERYDALRGMLRSYVEHMHTNEPVHTWAVD